MDLVAAVRAGDDRAFELLFVRYQARVAAYVRGMVRDHERTEDITQEVFIAALRRIRATDGPIAFKPWIYEIAKNACIDAFRRARNTTEVPFGDDDAHGRPLVAPGGAPDAVVDTKLAIDNLCGAFGGLSQAHHDILVMREFEGLSYQEIGERLGMSRAAVESTLFRARRRLSEEYDELVSGERCLRVRAIVDAPPGRAIGLRDQRRMARHVAHCQPCRRHARRAGVDLGVVRAPAVARIAALMPLPAFLRRRFDLDDGGQLLGGHQGASAAQWSKVVMVLDPATVSGWPRAIAAAATVAVAGLGAGAAVGERPGTRDAVPPAASPQVAPAFTQDPATRDSVAPARSSRSTSSRERAAPSGGGADEPGHDPKLPSGGTSREPAPAVVEPAPSSQSGSEPAARPNGTPAGATGAGATLPKATLPSIDASAVDVPATRPPRERPSGGIIDGVGTAVGGMDASVPDTLGDVVDAVGNTLAPAAEQAGSDAAGTATQVGSAPATGDTVSSLLGEVLGGSGAGPS